MSLSACCTTGFEWDGTPKGKTIPFPTHTGQAYVAGSNADAAVMIIHDALGWAYPNVRLLADHFAEEAQVTVYVPDFFGDTHVPYGPIDNDNFEELIASGALARFMKANSREVREPEVFECAKKLRSEYKKLAAIGYCWGGWACWRLAAKGNDLVDCISTGHPSLVTKEDIDGIAVPTQTLAPETDQQLTPELKEHLWKTLQANGIPFDYQHFPGVVHGCLVRGSPKIENERAAMARGKDAAVSWFRQYLKTE